MNTPEDIDRLFRNETERLSEVPPGTSFNKDRFWQQLESRLEPHRRKRRFIIGYRVAAGILFLIISTLAGWRFYSQQQQLNAYAAELVKLKQSKVVTSDQVAVDTARLFVPLQVTTQETVLVKKLRKADSQKPKPTLSPLAEPSAQAPVVLNTGSHLAEAPVKAGARKPFRIVPKSQLPHSWKEIPDTQDVYVKTDRQHTPKLTISLTPKTDQ